MAKLGSAIISNFLACIFGFISPVWASPVPRGLILTRSLDYAPDAWADTLSGVGPLIILIGERNTKQLLRNFRGFHHIYSLALAPLGLLSLLTSTIRMCGSQRLRGFIGYELEAR